MVHAVVNETAWQFAPPAGSSRITAEVSPFLLSIAT